MPLNAATVLVLGSLSTVGSGMVTLASVSGAVPHDTITITLPVFVVSVVTAGGAMFRLGHYKAVKDIADKELQRRLDEQDKLIKQLRQERSS